MEIRMIEIPIRYIASGYKDDAEEGVYGYDDTLNIRPPYQREFVYKDKQRDAVIDTIRRGFPLNTMYWAQNQDCTYEVLDGQQRTISFCQFINGDFSIIDADGTEKYFHTLTNEEQEQILNYKVLVYICKGSDKERLDWFRTINIAGEKLTDQELLNINYTGSWLFHAKRLFSKTGCNAVKVSDKYVKGVAIRQELLETALCWIAGGKDKIAGYMAKHQHDSNANELWLHFNKVLDWVKCTFPVYRKEMKGIDWGRLYAEYGNESYDIEGMERKINLLMSDEDVTNKKGVYEYVLSRCTLEKVLSVRTFSDRDKRTAYERQNGICPICGNKHNIEDMHGDHIVEWANGGKTIIDNLQMVCHTCHKKLTKTLYD